jgi:FkbM family methyltransferase
MMKPRRQGLLRGHSGPRDLGESLNGKARRTAKLGQLKARKLLSGGDVFVDYGWIKLLFSDDGDTQELYYHLDQRKWYAQDMAFYSRFVRPGATVIDVGANLGFVTTMLASLVGPTGRVLSFEPSDATYTKLLKTIAVNEMTQVVAYNNGLGATRETVDLIAVSRSSGNNTLVPASKLTTTQHETVNIVPLDDVEAMQDNIVSLLKIDTEGYEFHVLQGATQMITRDKPVIYTELGGGDSYAHTTSSAISLLKQLGYDTSHTENVAWNTVGNGVDFAFFHRDHKSASHII